jgi:flagellar biosynthesis protein FliR
MVVRVTLSSADVAADAIGPLFGLGVPSVYDPMTLTQSSVLVRIMGLMITLVAVLVGLHRVALGSILASFHVLPVGSVVDPSVAAMPLLRMVASAVSLGLRLALPMVAVLLMTHIALAFISRASPSMQIFSIGFAASLVVGTIVFVGALPDLITTMSADLSAVGPRIEGVISVLMKR